MNLMRSDPFVLKVLVITRYSQNLRAGYHTIQPKRTSYSKGIIEIFNLAATRELQHLVTSGLSFTAVQTAEADWSYAVHPTFAGQRNKAARKQRIVLYKRDQ